MASRFPTNVARSPDNFEDIGNTQPSGFILGEITSDERTSNGSSSDASADLEHLPHEVLINIIRSCETENTTSMTRNLCLVSKHMEPVARQELYRAIVITSNTGLRTLITALMEKPELGQFVLELDLLVPRGRASQDSYTSWKTEENIPLCLQYIEVLKRSRNLRRLTMMLADHGGNRRPTTTSFQNLTEILSNALTHFQQSDSITAVLPRLEKLLLTSDAHLHHNSHRFRATVHPMLFKSFLPVLSSLECISDSGPWNNSISSVHPAGSVNNGANVQTYPKVKSVVLRDSESDPTDLMDLINTFPALEVLFVQNRPDLSTLKQFTTERATTIQNEANQSEKRYLSDSFEKLHGLKTLAFVPHRHEFESPIETKVFMGPSNFLSLKKLSNLTSLSILINVFASPNFGYTGQQTVSPMGVLPSSLKLLHLIVDHHSARDVSDGTPLNEDWFQPRAAAVEFMEELASICPTEFPRLRQAEYIWAVKRLTRRTGGRPKHDWRHRLRRGDISFGPDQFIMEPDCNGSVPLCCNRHARIQALSPDVDYTSKAEGIVSPFRERFDNLNLAFNKVGVAFEVIELEEYDDFLFHWRGD